MHRWKKPKRAPLSGGIHHREKGDGGPHHCLGVHRMCAAHTIRTQVARAACAREPHTLATQASPVHHRPHRPVVGPTRGSPPVVFSINATKKAKEGKRSVDIQILQALQGLSHNHNEESNLCGGGIHTLPSHLSSGVRDLISQMLVVDPMKRITMREIHRHPWFQALARGLELSLPDPV
ncbi:hypothetical protein Taro_024385 [Colocasia esculenta]|uniref:Uncharacterized protein n=1 Tax=Colocasia esculenta TaxID=4460 RepID=A0A843V6N6_COLES|nr:hypothetical protein [Colocasia esculenta]